jgi:hypothetical protein
MIFENNEKYSISFNYNGKDYNFSGTLKDTIGGGLNFLVNQNFEFDPNSTLNKPLNFEDISNNPSYKNYLRGFYKLDNGKYFWIGGNVEPSFARLINYLEDFGIKNENIHTKGYKKNDDQIKKFNQINPPTPKFQKRDRAEPTRVGLKNPFGCRQNDGKETSALCILGKSGSGKTVTTENALDSMGHEYYLYIPIEGEYTFTQYTGTSFELSSIGEFILQAKNDPTKFYTLIFDEAHRPFTINKLNFDLLQALSSKRNRDGQRFFTMDKITKRMFTNPNPEEFETGLIESRGKVLVPDNFGIVLLSSNMSIIPRNPDLFNRVDIVLFKEEFRKCEDLTRLKKLEANQKNEDFIEQFFINQEV